MSAAEQRHYCTVCSAVFRTPFSRCPLDGNVLAELDVEGDPLVGTTLDGRYVIEECIGEGGMGRVYRAKHTRMSRNYAIKILFGDHAGDSRMRSRFAREAEAVSRLHHTNVISVVDFGENEGGLLYLVMDLAKGESLAAMMIQEAPMAPDRAIAILGQLAKGLAHAHSQGLVHRDFKGENVIMVRSEEQEVPKIVDFGICMITEDSPSSTMLTSNGMVMGTPAVMAPEQASGDTVDHRTDLFSLGIVGYQMLSGKLPFEGTPLDMARKNLYEPIPPIMERSGVAVAPALEAIIHKLTAKRPEDRYQSAKAALADLQNLGTGWNELPTDWNAPTPIPAHVANVASGAHYPRQHTDSGVSGNYGDPRSTPMTTQSLGYPGFQQANRKRSWLVPVLISLIVVVVVAAAAIGFSGKDEAGQKMAANTATAVDNLPDSGTEVADTTPVEADPTESDDKPLATENGGDPEVGNPKAGNPKADIKDLTNDTTEDPKPDGNPENTDPKNSNPKNSNPKNSGRKNPKNAGRKNPKNAGRKNPKNKPPDNTTVKTEKPEITVDEVKKLYRSVGSALDTLEYAKGKPAVAKIRRDYNAISYMKLARDASMTPIYHQSLLRLRRKIKAAHKK